MKNILYIADTFPYPVTSGGKIRTFNLLKIISENNNVDFFCINDEKTEKENISNVEKMCNSVNVTYNGNKSKIKRMINFFMHKSDKLFLNYSEELDRKITDILDTKTYDVIFIDSLFLYQYIIGKKINRTKTKIILDIHNVENEILFRTMKENKNIIVKLYSYIEHKNIKKIEQASINDSDYSLVVSERDKNEYEKLFNIKEGKIFAIENGFDSQVAVNAGEADLEEEFILFVGSLWYRPNYDGLDWFLNNVWDDMRVKNPNLKLKIIGKYRDEEKKVSKINVEYLGFVEDLSIYYSNCICAIVPLFIGSGTRLKILEAFSYKCPVISTDIGCEGIDIIDGENIIIANKKEEFINAIDIVKKQENRNKLVENAYNLIKYKYEWSIIKKKLLSILEEV